MFHSFLSKFVIYRGVLLSSSFSQTWDRVFLAVSTCPSRIEPREHVQKIIGRSKKEVKCCKPISGSESNWGGYGSVFRTQEIEFFHAWSEQIGINRGAAACATFSRGPKWLKSHAHWGFLQSFDAVPSLLHHTQFPIKRSVVTYMQLIATFLRSHPQLNLRIGCKEHGHNPPQHVDGKTQEFYVDFSPQI